MNGRKDFALIESLRPNDGDFVQSVVVSTFSLDMVVLLALLRGLAGLKVDSTESSAADDLRAVLRLAHRTVVLCQNARIRPPSRFGQAKRLSPLDACIVSVKRHERQSSWHPKMILVGYGSRANVASSWRLWLGSRNLSRSRDADFGVLLNGSPVPGLPRQPIPSLQEAFGAIFSGAPTEISKILASSIRMNGAPCTSISDQLKYLASSIYWEAPRGTSVEEIAASGNSGIGFHPSNWLSLPNQGELRDLWLVSPFVNDGLRHVLGACNLPKTRTVLVSTDSNLHALSEYIHSRVTARSAQYAPAHQGSSVPPSDAEEPANDIAADLDQGTEAPDYDPQGLHAKIILARRKSGPAILWLGSANLTQRGLSGRNAEVIARLSIPAAAGDKLVSEFLGLSRGFIRQRDFALSDLEERSRILEVVRSDLAAELNATLAYSKLGAKLAITGWKDGLVPLEMSVAVAPLTRLREFVTINSGNLTASWENIGDDEFTEFLCFKLTDAAPNAAPPISWIQKAEVSLPPSWTLEKTRQAREAALLWKLGLDGVCSIILAELAGSPSTQFRKKGGRKKSQLGDPFVLPDSFRVEELLRQRIRNPNGWRRESVQWVTRTLEGLKRTAGIGSSELEQLHALWQPFSEAFGALED